MDDAQKFETLRDDGIRAMQIGEAVYAEKCFNAALKLQDDAKVRSLLAEVYLRQQRFEEALPILRVLAEQTSVAENVELHLILAQTFGRLKQYEAERQTCEALLQVQADEPRALYLAAEADHGLGDELQAIVHLTQCLAQREDYGQARLLRVKVLIAMGQMSEALADLEPLMKENPEDEECLLLQSSAMAALGRPDDAIVALEKVRLLNPFNEEAVLQLGALFEATSRWDKALALYDEAIELTPDFSAAYKARGGVKHHLKDDLGAAEDLKRSLELAPEKGAELDGEYTNVENEMNAKYRNMNPYGF